MAPSYTTCFYQYYTKTSGMKCFGILRILLYLENTSFIFTKIFVYLKNELSIYNFISYDIVLSWK